MITKPIITWLCNDESGVQLAIVACSGIEAAREYIRGGDYHDCDGEPLRSTIWGSVWVEPEGEGDDAGASYKIPIDPIEPPCLPGRAHDWQAPIELVGGCKENPGIHGHGGGVTITEVCIVCGCWRRLDTWATDRADGEQGLRSTTYEPGLHADWAQARAELDR